MGDWAGLRKKAADLEHNEIGYLSIDKSTWTHCYSKILNYNTLNIFSPYTAMNSIGRMFTIKDKELYEAKNLGAYGLAEIGKTVNIAGISTNRRFAADALSITISNNVAVTNGYVDSDDSKFRPMLTLKPIGDPEGTVLYCEITAKLITQPYGYDRTIKFKPIYSKYNITKVELVLNIDENGNYNTKGSTGTFGADVLAGIVPPKNDETICIEFKTVNQKASGNAYTLKITFNNGKVLYLQDALITTGNSLTDVTNVRYDIYRENKLK